MDDFISAQQISRLSHWLQSQGMTAEQILDCIDYIAKTEPAQSKMPAVPAATNSETPGIEQTDE